MSSLLRRYGRIVVTAAFTFLVTLNLHAAPNFTVQTFATGTTLGTTQPDSTYFGLGIRLDLLPKRLRLYRIVRIEHGRSLQPNRSGPAIVVYPRQCGRPANRSDGPRLGFAK